MGGAAGIWKMWHELGLYTRMTFAAACHVIRQQYAPDGKLLVRIDTSPLFAVGTRCWGLVDDTDLVAFVVSSLAIPLDALAALDPDCPELNSQFTHRTAATPAALGLVCCCSEPHAACHTIINTAQNLQ